MQTLAFLLTNIEDSTVLWELHTDAMRSAVAEHDRILLRRRRRSRRTGREARRRRRRSRLRGRRGGGRGRDRDPARARRGRLGRAGAAAGADGDRRRRGRGPGRGLLRAGAQSRRQAARRRARRTGAPLGGRARRIVGVARRMAGEGAWRVPVQGHRQHATRLPAPARRPSRRIPAPQDRPPATSRPARRVRPLSPRIRAPRAGRRRRLRRRLPRATSPRSGARSQSR